HVYRPAPGPGLVVGHAPGAAEDPGVGREEVDRADVLLGVLDQRLDIGLDGLVRGAGHAPLADLVSDGQRPVGVPVHHDDRPGALGGEPPAQLAPDAAGAAGDDADAIAKLHGADARAGPRRGRTGPVRRVRAGRRDRGQPAPMAARIVASAEARRSRPHGSGMSTGTSTPASYRARISATSSAKPARSKLRA